MHLSKELRDLTLKIYDAVANQQHWSSALDQLVERVGAQGSIIFEWTTQGADDMTLTAPLHSGFYSKDALAVYLSKCQHLEAGDQDVLRRQTNDHDDIELLDDSLLAGSVEELKQQEHVKKLMRLGIFHRAAGIMNKDNPWISLFSVQLNAKRQPLNEEERAFLSTVLPHLAKALDLSIPMRQLQNRYMTVLSSIDQLNIGVCILDARGMIVARNLEFQRQQEAYRTFRTSAEGRLRITDHRAQRCFEELMIDIGRHGRFGARPRKECILSHTLGPLCIEITPLRNADEMGSRAFNGFIVCSTDTGLPFACNVSRIQKAFGLTGAETELVDAIGHGLTNPEIADRRGRSVSTVNSQTKSILAKTNCATRTQFVRMMMRYGASFLQDTSKDETGNTSRGKT